MVRNEFVTRIVMLLCFSTAILYLTVHWRFTASKTSTQKLETGEKVRANAATTFQKPWDFVLGNKQNANGYYQQNALFAQIATQQSSNNLASQETKVVVHLSDRRVYVYRFGQVIASYPIGVGKKGWETPLGSYQVINKQPLPIWRHPITGQIFPSGSDSPLGDRWIGFWSDGRNQIGFHGTPEEKLVGTSVSHGCLRMRNADVRMLYNQVKISTKVEVRQ